MKTYTLHVILSIYLFTHCMQNTCANDDSQSKPTFDFSEVKEGKNAARYIVKYKPGSNLYESRMKAAARNPKRVQDMDPLFTFGSFIPQENAEVVLIPNINELERWENNDDVEYVEAGKWHSRLNISVFTTI